jgi:polar amino acid transport system substrate-binding protein
MFTMSRFLYLLNLCAGLMILASCKPSTDAGAPLRVGMDLSYPPFETIGADGSPAGVSVELAEALGGFLQRPVRIENIPFVGLIPSLQTGKIDLIISSMTATEERTRSIAFSDPYLTIGLALLVGKNSAVVKSGDLDEAGRKVVVRQGTTGQVWAQNHLTKAKVIVLDKENSAVLEVIQGKADAFVYDQMSVWKNAMQHPEATRAILEPLQKETWAVGLRPGDEELRVQVNEFLREFRDSGGFERLGEKFLKDQKRAFAEQDLQFYF